MVTQAFGHAAHRQFMTIPESANAPAVDELLLSAALSLASAGQSQFMDIDMVRTAYGRSDQAPVTGHDIVDALTRLVQSKKLIPFVDPVIARGILRSPRSYKPRSDKTAAAVIAALGDDHTISDEDMLGLVRHRNVLVSFRVGDEAADDFG
jgi:hypothetical protein